MSRLQPIFDIAELCAKKGVVNTFLCPGSRCAPLTLAFARHPEIKARTFSDERSAGFIALGAAQQSGSPSILTCTSGSAAYNLAPAIAEAYFSETPLIIFTADRPAEWIAQHDGQTIYQAGIFGQHVKKTFQLPQDYDHADSRWAINRIVNEAINLSQEEPRGPVHINAPFREPLYPAKDEVIAYSQDVVVTDQVRNASLLSEEHKKWIRQEWSQYNHILIVAGQHDYDESLTASVNEFVAAHPVPLVADIISNLHGVENTVVHADAFLGQASDAVKKSLQPDLLITFGKSVISKNVKTFLRQHKPKAHWHIQPAGAVADPFQLTTHILRVTPVSVFNFLSSLSRETNFENQKQHNFHKLWEVEERRAVRAIEEFFPHGDLAEFEVVNDILQKLPDNATLHLANSMSVRYANFIGLKASQQGIRVFANRGTSGIDGCTSTATGHSLMSDGPHVLITGDIAFFYDRNAFWHKYPIPNLRVVLLNNHGGVIFKIIDGPSALPESDEYFVTEQKLNAKALCAEFGFIHIQLDHRRKAKNLIKDFFDFDGKVKILEVETSSEVNKSVFDSFKQKIKKSYEL